MVSKYNVKLKDCSNNKAYKSNLDTAISQYEERALGLSEQGNKLLSQEYRQLAVWLRELRIYKASENIHHSIPELIFKAHNNAIDKGWWEEEKSLGDMVALMHSELSEVLEDGRKGKEATEVYYECKRNGGCPYLIPPGGKCKNCSDAKPCGIPIEFADLVIRVFDYCGAKGIDLEKAILEKMEFNKTRPRKHGKKF